MVLGLEGQVAIVTGAASGIGRATAMALAMAGARVVLVDVTAEDGEHAVEQVKGLGGEAQFVQADVSNPRDVETMMQHTMERFGQLDCACNNAGIEGLMAPTAECPEDNWDRVIRINLKGVWLCMKAEIPAMLAHGNSAIVNVASVAGLVGFRNMPAYCASKAGIIQLTRTAALEYAQQGIRVNAVCPGGVRTPMVDRIVREHPEMEEGLNTMHPIGRMGTPAEIADAIVWLCSKASSFVTGQALAVDGGYVAQ